MSIQYPNGKRYRSNSSSRSTKTSIAYGGRGMSFESDIDESNTYYLLKEQAVIHKKPTPIQIVNVDYPKRSAAVIKEAYFKQASTTDYNGVYKGHYIDFEAKETKNKTSFPLQNIHQHQVDHMRNVVKQNGICFLLIRFQDTKEVFLLDATVLISFYDHQTERKSIKKADIMTYGHHVHTGYQPFIDYLRTVDELYIN
ncbi:Holliday junction resolvase RecU [Shouchella sp. JSM 1781072]|uniref:Holliday junction resolvase RecU n=1 Tax=Bacillaceae TaxID=186817 RepID=UPI000C077928|nr:MULTISPECIES: Holliday junction resolvase RecU [Bacillaceae]UTR08348.1 Holliday junction resolvase RecU [Alkalihalobacillus sp. LMS6]